ncbi:amino acid/amide ABC transporter membrane protein 1, HAAT family [Aliiroseovarius halocynthiae]|uniref:Urea ABC transporter permease subunit UrtB n=1 Tax=Aliiroseovarius halocynthiae TaxID=985055 RepID=A0A545SUI4_9RHOB|nr:urea ABC transporter permease subunit UrtB [Aliiroseovarius halocynthiae]TQV68618.1 urea ABC transporter permease subunit UrtB [Aliiroseovarius halocynthiae]SMR71033.1 amino acid/amide ABC transporter membrane protein 1, HAAT family [Aliiroseovarius halocynthiae]
MRTYVLAALMFLGSAVMTLAQTDSPVGPIQTVLQNHKETILKSSRKTIGPAIDAVVASKLPQARSMLNVWQSKNMWHHKPSGLFYQAQKAEGKIYRLLDLDTGDIVDEVDKSDLKQIKPNSGIRALIATALVRFQLEDPDPLIRAKGLTGIERAPDASLLKPLLASIDSETDPELKARKSRLAKLLTISFSDDGPARIAAIEALSGDLGLDVRGALNPLVSKVTKAFEGEIPSSLNVAQTRIPGRDEFTKAIAYQLLVDAGKAPAQITGDQIRVALGEHIDGGLVGGVPIVQLGDEDARIRAYSALATAGKVPPLVSDADIESTLSSFSFADIYAEPSPDVSKAAEAALSSISTRVSLSQTADLTLDALSLASIYFLAAIGLAITFGVMGVINMAHGEFIMMGAYTGYVVQQLIPNHTVSIIVAVPLAFAVTFAAGVALERLVIRWLYNRPLETLLATFGVSIALQQLAKNIFGTQARPLTAPEWLDGALVLNPVISISYIRIAIFVLALIFLGVFLYIMKRTRLGLETRAVTQNPQMAGAMGINPGRVNMLTFGLGSGIAGVAGVAIGLFAKVTSELGSDYIVQSFMTVVVGGVGNIWGTLAGATMIGFFQKGVEWMNPSNTLAAQTYMIIFIIIFIQFRPRGIIALKGRAAGD